MKFKTVPTLVVGCAIALAAGLVLASNMGFLIQYQLDASDTGIHYIALPYKPATGLNNAADVYTALGGGAVVTSVARLNPLTDTMEVYTGGPDNNFTLAPGEGLIVQMSNTVSYKLLGAHDPATVITLLGPESSATGTTLYAPPYHRVATKASELRDEIGVGAVVSVSRYVRSAGGFETYSGQTGDPDFSLIKGESYVVQVNRTTQYRPKTQF